MLSGRIAAAVALTAVIASCGGGADPQAFAREANKACRDLKQDYDAIPEDRRLAEGVKAYERELKRLQELEPPADTRARYRQMLSYKEQGLNAWREFVRHAEKDEFEAAEPAGERSTRLLVRAAQIAGQLQLDDCDRALS